MAIVRIPAENRSLQADDLVQEYLKGIGIDYEHWNTENDISQDASSDQILRTYEKQINELKERGGYVRPDVIDINRDTPGPEAMLAKFNIEHYHNEDEVRFIVDGRGLFHIHPQIGPVVAIEVESGDLIRVPSGTLHWFGLCGESAQYVYFRTNPAGLLTIRTALLIESMSPWYMPPQKAAK